LPIQGRNGTELRSKENTMRKQAIVRLFSGLAVAILMIALPAMSHAATITSITVAFGGTTNGIANTFCNIGAGCANQIWDLSGGVQLGGVGGFTSLVLTQTGSGGTFNSANHFNFDTSDLTGAGPAMISITVAGLGSPITFTDNFQILNQPT